MIPDKNDTTILKKVINEMIDRKFHVSGWKELYYAMFGKCSGGTNRSYYLNRLSSQDQKVLTLRYGLKMGESPKTLEQVGKRLGYTRERIRQIEKRALERLKGIYRKTYNQYSKSKKLNDSEIK